jgi:mediator of RNA polymerase II transcription subunit 5
MKIMQEQTAGDVKIWIERIWNEPSCQPIFASLVSKVRSHTHTHTHIRIYAFGLSPYCARVSDVYTAFAQRFSAAVFSMDVDSLGLTCKILHTYDHALEMVALHVRIYDLIFFSLQFLEEYDCETVGAFQFNLVFWFRLAN